MIIFKQYEPKLHVKKTLIKKRNIYKLHNFFSSVKGKLY